MTMAYERKDDALRAVAPVAGDKPSAPSLTLALLLSLSLHLVVLWVFAAPGEQQAVRKVAVLALTPQPQAARPPASEQPPRPEQQTLPQRKAPAPALSSRRQAAAAARRSYLDVIYALLDARKTYPASALRRRREGSATLKMVIDRNGALVSVEVADADGEDFAHATLAAASKAQPFPPLPREVPGATLSVDVTLVYRLKR